MNTNSPLLESLTKQARDAELAQQRAETEARERYMADLDRLASGDERGIDQRKFTAAFKTLGMSLADVEKDVATIRRIRGVEAQDDATRQAVEAAMQVAAEVEAAEKVAAAAHEAATRAAREARQRANWAGIALEARDSRGDLTRTEVARVAARKDATALRERGFAGELLRAPIVPPPTMARFIGPSPDLSFGAVRRAGDVFQVPRGTMLGQPPRMLKPGEVPEPHQNYLVPADAPWPPAVRKRRFRCTGDFQNELLGNRRVGDVIVRDVPDGTMLPWCLEELELLPEPAPAPVDAPVEAATDAEMLRGVAIAPAPVEDQLDALLGDLEQEEQQ